MLHLVQDLEVARFDPHFATASKHDLVAVTVAANCADEYWSTD
jgi:hypothetical protein